MTGQRRRLITPRFPTPQYRYRERPLLQYSTVFWILVCAGASAAVLWAIVTFLP